MTSLLNAQKGNAVQVMPLVQGKINITSSDGDQESISLIYCSGDGTIRITWNDATTTDVVCTAGDTFSLPNQKSTKVAVQSGTFHLA